MTRYAVSQILFAGVLAVVGTVKAYRILVDAFDDRLSSLTGLT